MHDPIFILGMTRSGSTLWHNVIAMDATICRLAEMHFLTPWRRDFRYFLRKYIGDLKDQDNIYKMIDMIQSKSMVPGINSPFWRFEKIPAIDHPDFRDKLYQFIDESDKSTGALFKSIMHVVTELSGYEKCCVKFPVNINHLPDLLRWYPNAKIVHIIRDPRAVAMSKTNDPGGTAVLNEKYPYAKYLLRKTMICWVIAQYVWASKVHRSHKTLNNYQVFKYEDLVYDPETTIRELYAFLDINFNPSYVDVNQGKHEHQPSSISGIQQKGINVKTASHWKTKISPFEERMIVSLTKRSMLNFEYDYLSHPSLKSG